MNLLVSDLIGENQMLELTTTLRTKRSMVINQHETSIYVERKACLVYRRVKRTVYKAFTIEGKSSIEISKDLDLNVRNHCE